MKRGVYTGFFILTLFSILILVPGIKAYKDGYEVSNYTLLETVTMDGNWTTSNEWVDADEEQLDGSLNVTFKLKYETDYPTYVNEYYLVEFFDDTTNDPDDYWTICYEAPEEVDGTPIGGTNPQTDCLRWDFVGHDMSGFAFYKGDGSDWVSSSGYNWGTDILIVESFGTSPLSDTPHWIVEIMIEHLSYSIGTPQWIRIAAYDASNSDAGEQAWPESSVTVPDDWGLSTAMNAPIPEALTIGAIVLLSSAAVIVSFYCLRKRPKTKVIAYVR